MTDAVDALRPAALHKDWQEMVIQRTEQRM